MDSQDVIKLLASVFIHRTMERLLKPAPAQLTLVIVHNASGNRIYTLCRTAHTMQACKDKCPIISWMITSFLS